jgi:hypothetical protein
MPNAIIGETHERHLFLERTIATAADMLGQDMVRAALAPSARERFLEGVDNLCIANFRDGVISKPSAQTGIPIVALNTNEKAKWDSSNSAMCPPQFTNATIRLQEHGLAHDEAQQFLSDEVLAQQRNPASRTDVVLGSNTGAAIFTRRVLMRLVTSHKDFGIKIDNDSTVFVGEPLIVMRIPEDEHNEPLGPYLVHELRHVEQRVDTPVLPEPEYLDPEARLSRELDAYRAQATLSDVLYYSSGSPYYLEEAAASALAWRIERLRKKFLGPDGLTPTAVFKMVLKENGLDHIYLDEATKV